MFNRSISYRLGVFVSIAVIAVYLTFILIFFWYNRKFAVKAIETEAIGHSNDATMLISSQLSTLRDVTNRLAEGVPVFYENGEIEKLLQPVMDEFEYIDGIYIYFDSIFSETRLKNKQYFLCRRNDSIVYAENNVTDCLNELQKKIFPKLDVKEKQGWSGVFRKTAGHLPVISCYSPVYFGSSGKKRLRAGSVICELSLNILNDSINKMKIAKNGYAFLIDEKGDFITHPNKKWILNRNINTFSNKIFGGKKNDIKKTLENKLKGSVIAYPEYLNYKKSWIYYTSIKETGWTFFFVVPYYEMFMPLYTIILKLLLFSIVGLLIIFLIITGITNKFIQPLSQATLQLKSFSNLSGEKALSTMDEVKMVLESLNFLQRWYGKFRINQLKEEMVSNQLQQDLQEALGIQMSLIQNDFSKFNEREDLGLFAAYNPARIVSGDLFDCFFIDDDTLFFSIGDVSGKGVSAAFFMSVAQTIIKSNARWKKPEVIVSKANNELTTANSHQFFLTLFVGILNLKTGTLNYCNAAHTSTIIIHDNQEITELEESHGMPLGLYAEKKYLSNKITIKPGDTIWLYTDGVTDMQNTARVSFGKAGMLEAFQRSKRKNPKVLVQTVEKVLEKFRGKNKLTDDVTMMAIRYNGKRHS
ncbi:MAG: hypothetical protein CR996_01350 [Draconibacterium sp.]|nr:MAG: hypothetical protein CR996_01350 [Draconibacterium sp.]PIF05556.1 MAG: hypothetical protein CSA36_06065 [Draconibacterium sp.]